MKQNKKLQISLIGITLLLLIFCNINDKQESNAIEIELNKATNLDTDITSDLSVMNITAKKNEETEIIASDFYAEIFGIVGMDGGIMANVESGQSISVGNFYDQNEPPSQFIPLYSNSKVVGISIFRVNSGGLKELGSVAEIHEPWYRYPPIAIYDAEAELNNKYPMLDYKSVTGYFFIEDRSTPYYLFESYGSEAIQYYLVNAYDKDIIVKKDKLKQEYNSESLPLRISREGLVELDLDALEIASITNQELQELKIEIAEINKLISNGTVKLDKDMHIIYDSREEDDIVFSSNENTQYSSRDSSNDKEMDNSTQEVPVIE
jgi:hypothetical protein